jgi:hypothetical protein
MVWRAVFLMEVPSVGVVKEAGIDGMAYPLPIWVLGRRRLSRARRINSRGFELGHAIVEYA